MTELSLRAADMIAGRPMSVLGCWAVNNNARGQCSIRHVRRLCCGVRPRQIGPICAWPSGKVARVMAEHRRIFCTDARRLWLLSVTGFHVSLQPWLAEPGGCQLTTGAWPRLALGHGARPCLRRDRAVPQWLDDAYLCKLAGSAWFRSAASCPVSLKFVPVSVNLARYGRVSHWIWSGRAGARTASH